MSISLVSREITRPDVYDSWNETLSDCECWNTRVRRLNSTPSETLTVYTTFTQVRVPLASTVTPKSTTKNISGALSPRVSGSIAVSSTRAISQGCTADAIAPSITAATEIARDSRCGRKISRSRRYERFRACRRSSGDRFVRSSEFGTRRLGINPRPAHSLGGDTVAAS